MTRRITGRIWWAVFLSLLACSFVAPEPYSGWAWFFCIELVAASIAYILSQQSSKPRIELLKNAVIACVVIGGFCGVIHGEPQIDENGSVVDEGFTTTFDSKAGVGVKVFLQLLAGSYVGIQLAGLVREDEHERT